ncbi:MAG: hypothetical protein KY455_03740 [Euryarchaeota archaeon]|nr:hypothetical protein [Euryarchaeota archaeon]
MRPFSTILVLLSIILSGCVSETPDADPDEGRLSDPTVDPPRPRVYDLESGILSQEWSVGDWWRYKVEYTSGESYDAKIFVYDEDGQYYHITSDSRDLILRSTIQHHPNLTPVEKGTLAQSIHGVKVEDFQWPMKNGTWTGPYRDTQATWTTSFQDLQTGKGPVPGFKTEMSFPDGNPRVVHGWSPVTKWFTDLTFDFDGVAPVDVTVTLQDWGTNHTGTFPLVEFIDHVHRPFPAYTVPPDPANVPGGEATDTFVFQEEGATLMWVMFAGAGGPGDFEYSLGHSGSQASHSFPWRPTAAGSYFAWGEIEGPPTGEWGVTGTGSAQGFAFLFLEAYEVRTTEGSLPME